MMNKGFEPICGYSCSGYSLLALWRMTDHHYYSITMTSDYYI